MGDDENACVRNIVKEIMRELIPKKIKVNKNFVTYLTKLLLINPNWGIGDDFFSQRQNVQIFVKYVIDGLLTEQDDPKIVTLKLQFYFSCNLDRMDYVIELNRKELKSKIQPLREDICNVKKVEGKDEVYIIFKKIVYYITLITGLGNPSKPKVFEEALMALKSILLEEELQDFVKMTKLEKHHQLLQFASLVAGIRLFNKDCDKGGEGMKDLPELLDKASEVIKRGIEETLVTIMEKVNALTTLVDKCYVLRNTYFGCQLQYVKPEETITNTEFDVEYIKDLLIFYRQYELLIRKILDEVEQIQQKTDVIWINLDEVLLMIHRAVYMKIAIPVGIVFPLFEQLWEIWKEFQNQGIFLSRLSMIMSNMETYSKLMHHYNETIKRIIGNSVSMTDAERLAETADQKLVSNNPVVIVVSSEAIKNFTNMKLEYLGFCCWKLIESEGSLIPGNPSMGIAIYNNKHYVFSCVEGFQEFQKDPQMYVNCVLDLARRKPHLINFFQLKTELENVYSIEKLVESKVEIRLCEDKSAQTVVHNVDSNIDPKYKWNIWDLKREALTNSKLLSAVTSSTQTDKTGSKNSVRTQTYDLKDCGAQTSTDNYSNVPKPSVFIYGLRGRKDDKQFKIDLTRPVEES